VAARARDSLALIGREIGPAVAAREKDFQEAIDPAGAVRVRGSPAAIDLTTAFPATTIGTRPTGL
jgi:hypothetical protein